MAFKSLFLLSALAFNSAQADYDTGVYGLGTWNESYALEANANPNNTNSVPFSIGTKNYTFQVNIAGFTPTGYQANRTQNPHQVASFYNLLWQGGNSLNESIRDAVTSGTGEGISQLCLFVPLGPMSRTATNGYREQDAGDCSNAFGKQCMEDLKKIDGSQTTGGLSCQGMWMPKSCTSRFGDGGLAFTALVNPFSPKNETEALLQYSPAEISYYRSQIFSAGNESYYDREDERLHAIFLTGSWGVTPVCNRINNTKLGKDDIAVSQGGAAGLRGSNGFALVMAVTVVMVLL